MDILCKSFPPPRHQYPLGYDVAAAKIPAVIILRGTQDNEQARHCHRLNRASGLLWRFFAETQIDGRQLGRAVTDLLANQRPVETALEINGAERAANFLYTLLT